MRRFDEGGVAAVPTTSGDGARPDDQVARLAKLGHELLGVTELDELVSLILRCLADLTQADRALLVVADSSGKGARVLAGVDGMGVELPERSLDFDRDVLTSVLPGGVAQAVSTWSGTEDRGGIIVAPLHGRLGLAGCLYAAFDRESPVSSLPMARLVAVQAALAMELHGRAEEHRRADRVSMENEVLRRRSREQSEQARVVEELNQRLTRTTAFLENLLESSTEHAIVAIDLQGQVTTWNTGAARTYGFPRDEILGQRLDTLLSHEDRERGLLEEMMEGACGESGRFAAETVRLKKDGALINTQVALTAIRGSGGEVTGFLDVSRDVSSQHEMRRQLLLSEKMAALGTLAAGVAHEFNNLVQGITGYLGHALEHDDKETWGKAMRVALDAGNRAALLTRRLQAFARPQVTGLVATHLPDVVEDTFALVEGSFGSEGVELTREYGDDLPPAMADRSRISQVLLNLLTNARHAVADSDRRAVSVIVSAPEPAWLEITVTDSGCGIPVEVQSRIFEPFFTTKGALGGNVFDGKVHGTGLGLAITSGIVTDHKGTMSVESRAGEGTAFRVRLPVADGSPAEGREGGANPSEGGQKLP